MKKLILLFSIVLASIHIAIGQGVNDYSFSSFAGTYTPVSAGTQLIAAGTDDGNSAATNIGFNFVFNGTTFTQFIANSNGHIRLGSSNPTSSYSPISSTTNTNAIAFFGRDGRAGGAVTYELTGTSPNQVLTIEYPAFNPAYGSSTTYLDAQIKLYETSNIVEIVYNSPVVTTTYTGQVGLRGSTATTDFNNRTTTVDWSTPTAGGTSAATMTLSSTVMPTNGLTYRWTPPSCLAPTALTVTNITTTTADLGWTSTVGLYDVEAGLPGFTPGTGTAVSWIHGTNANMYQAWALTPATTYEFYVRADCGGGDLSSWAGPYTFTTSCLTQTIPFFEGFEANHTHNTAIGNCWTQESVVGTNEWTANNAFTDYNRTPRTGSFNAFLRYGNTRWMFQEVELTGGVSYTFDIYARQDGATAANASITVAYGASPDAASMTNPIIPQTGIINGNYQLLTGVFTPAATGTYYIGVLGQINSTPWYISIDDIHLYESPTCLAPTSLTATNITTTSADLGWTSGAAEYQIEWGEAPLTPGTGTMVITTNNPYPLTGLTQGTLYEFYVRDICAVGDTSAWAGPFAFNTTCLPVSVFPFVEDFSAGVVPPLCWSELITNPTNNWQYNVSGYAEVEYDYSQDEWLLTPVLDFSALVNPSLSFDWMMSYYWGVDPNDNYDLVCNISTNGGATWTPLWDENSAGVFTSFVWYRDTISLSAYAGEPNVKIAWQYVGDDGAQAAIDNILIKDNVPAEINPVTADYDITWPGNVITTVIWNDATAIVSIEDDQGTPYTLIENTDYTLAGNTLTILDSYLSTLLLVATDDVVLTITFDLGVETFTITAIETVIVDAEINPVAANYDLINPANVSTTVTYNDALIILGIEDNFSTSLVLNTHYETAGNTLTILDSYLSTVLANPFDQVILTVSFDVGADATFTITAVEPGPADTLANWHFEDAAKRALITDNATFISSPYTADNGTAANVNIAPVALGGTPVFTGWVTGSGGTGTFAPNSNTWDQAGDKYWMVTISSANYENLKVSSKQMGSNTGPRDFQIEYSTDGLTWVPVGAPIVVLNDLFTSGVVDGLDLPSACNNQAALMVRWLNTSNVSINGGTVGSAGTNRIDDILITGHLITVSVPEFASDVKVYPNPSNGQFVIETDNNWTMMVYDITGRIVASQQITKGSNDINLLGQPSGLYMVRLFNKEQTQTIRIVIE